MFRHTLPHSCDLIFHFKCPKALVDWVQNLITLVTASPSIKAGNDNPVWTRQICGPVQLETVVHVLTAGASIPAQDSNSADQLITQFSVTKPWVWTYTSIRRGYLLDFLKLGGSIISYQRSVGKKNKLYQVNTIFNKSGFFRTPQC